MLIFIFSFHLVLKFFFLPHLCLYGICYCFCCEDATPTNAPPGGFSADEPYFSANEKIFRFPFVMTTREGSSAARRYLPGPIP